MPADEGDRGLMRALIRLLGAWRQRWASRRPRLDGFMGLSDRALADIGVRRADVHAAMVGAIPLGRRPAESDQPSEADVCPLPGRPRLVVVTNDLDAAA